MREDVALAIDDAVLAIFVIRVIGFEELRDVSGRVTQRERSSCRRRNGRSWGNAR
jgi:hypothetical protein